MPQRTSAKEKSILEYLFNFGSAEYREIAIAFGSPKGFRLSEAMVSLIKKGLCEEREKEGHRYYVLTKDGCIEVTESLSFYERNRSMYPGTGIYQAVATKGKKEAASMCMNLSARESEQHSGCRRIAVYMTDKPSPGLLLYTLRNRTNATENGGRGYPSELSYEEGVRLVTDGVFYTSSEFKRLFDDGGVGSENLSASRVTGILLKNRRIFVFYHSEGTIPRSYYDVEKRFIDALTGELLKTGLFGANRFEVSPTAIMVSRSYALIPALIMGYSHSRIRSDKSMENSPAGEKVRAYYQRHLFNPCSGLYNAVYCIPYRAYAMEDFETVVSKTPEQLRAEGSRWISAHLKDFGYPCGFNFSLTPYAVGSDKTNLTDVIYAPVVDIAFFRMFIRNMYCGLEERDKVTVITKPRLKYELPRAISTSLASLIDVNSGLPMEIRRYSLKGYPLDAPDPYKTASDVRWSSPNRPYRQSTASVSLANEAAEEANSIAKNIGCSRARMLGDVVSAVMDTDSWKEKYRRQDLFGLSYREVLNQQDIKNGKPLEHPEKLRELGDSVVKGGNTDV